MIRWRPVVWTIVVLVILSALSPFVGGELPASYQWVIETVRGFEWRTVADITTWFSTVEPWLAAALIGSIGLAALILLTKRVTQRRPTSVVRTASADPAPATDRWTVASTLAQEGAEVAVIARRTQLAQDAVRELLMLHRPAAAGTNFRTPTDVTGRGGRVNFSRAV